MKKQWLIIAAFVAVNGASFEEGQRIDEPTYDSLNEEEREWCQSAEPVEEIAPANAEANAEINAEANTEEVEAMHEPDLEEDGRGV